MKIIATNLLIFLTSVSLFADSPEKFANLLTFEIDPKLQINNVNSGALFLNEEMKLLNLTLYTKYNCNEGEFCPLAMPAPIIIELPIVAKYQDPCRATVYKALKDSRPVDGNLQVLKVVDNSTNACKYFIAIPSVEISYFTKSSGMTGNIVKTLSKFTADPLESVYIQ